MAKVVKPISAAVESEEYWTSQVSGGNATCSLVRVGEWNAIRSIYLNALTNLKSGAPMPLPADAPLRGNAYTESISFESFAGNMFAKVTTTYAYPLFGSPTSASTRPGEKVETADFQVMERNVRYADFWVEHFGIKTGGNSAEELRCWKAIQAFLDKPLETYAEYENALVKLYDFCGESNAGVVETMLNLRLGGVDSFYVPVQTISLSTVDTSTQTNVGENVGKRDKPSGFGRLRPDNNLQWLKMCDVVSYDGVAYRREQRWSGADIWDKNLYGEE